jgi:uncharacterized membrane protein
MNEIVYQSLIALGSQIAFLWARTYNVHATARLEISNTLKSGIVIHLLWLIGISIGANGAYKVLVDFDWKYLPVLGCSLIGSVIGNYIGLIKRKGSCEKK